MTAIAFVCVRNRDRAIDFYTRIIGLPLTASDEYGDFLDLNGARLRMTLLPDFTASPHPLLGWEVPDIIARMAQLRDHGVVFSIYAGMGQDEQGLWTAPDGKVKVAWFPDSEGNLLSLSEV